MYKGPMDKAKAGKDCGWEGQGKVVVGKWRQLYLNKNFKNAKKKKIEVYQ